MNYTFSDRISSLKPSAIREILKVTSDPTVISFAAGSPAPDAFPAKEMAEITAELFATRAAGSLQYGMSEGYPALREVTATRLKEKFNIGKDFDELIITSGGQQAIELTAKAFLNEGDSLICEDPSFVGALNAFRSYGANLVACPMDEHGMKIDALEELLKTTENVKLIYTIPTFQNPTGRTMPLERRKRMLELAEKYDVMILEDNPYFELRYTGEAVPSIKSMDTTGRVIYAGSYSKIIAPGIRIGYCVADKAITTKLVVAKQVSDVHTNLFFQIVFHEYLTRYDLEAHIEKIRGIYSKKCSLMLNEIDKKFDKRITISRPEGGLFIYCELPEGFSGFELCKLAGLKKVAAVPGSAFSVDENAVCPGFRLNFSLPSEEQIITGIDLLAATINEYLGGNN